MCPISSFYPVWNTGLFVLWQYSGMSTSGGLAGVNFIAGIVGGVILIGYIGGGTNWYVQWKKEQKKKSHSKCICKRCGYTWYID